MLDFTQKVAQVVSHGEQDGGVLIFYLILLK
jgi:hypothetical protein